MGTEMTSTVYLSHNWVEFNETRSGEGYRVNWVRCKLCGKEIFRFVEYYKINGINRIPTGVEVISFEQCEHHNIIKSGSEPELYEFKLEDYYIIPK